MEGSVAAEADRDATGRTRDAPLASTTEITVLLVPKSTPMQMGRMRSSQEISRGAHGTGSAMPGQSGVVDRRRRSTRSSGPHLAKSMMVPSSIGRPRVIDNRQRWSLLVPIARVAGPMGVRPVKKIEPV